MKTISFLNNKGGVGKTTLCLNLAKAFSLIKISKEDFALPGTFKECPREILLIDSDSQKSLSDWHNAGNGINNLELVSADTRASLLSAQRLGRQINADLVMIDTPGKLAALSGAALSISDLVIVPVQPTPLDIWATYDTVDLILAAKNANPRLKALIVINKADPRSSLTADTVELIASEMHEMALCATVVYGRIAYARNISDGQTVFDSKDKIAIHEIECLAREIQWSLLYDQNDTQTKA